MEILEKLFFGFPGFWGGGVAHSVMILSMVVTVGLCLGRLRVRGVSLGLAWVLFVGLLVGNLGVGFDAHLLHFLKEFGLILFVYSIGLEVGPGFFSSLRGGGRSLNLLSVVVVALSIVTTLVVYSLSGTPVPTLAGILSGAVTNTPGLGAAQQALSDLRHIDAPDIATGYAIAYPVGVIGVIVSFVVLRFALRVDKGKEAAEAARGDGHVREMTLLTLAVRLTNRMVAGMSVRKLHDTLRRDFMISRITHADGGGRDEVVGGDTVLSEGDLLQVVAHPEAVEPLVALVGERVEDGEADFGSELVTRRVVVTRRNVNGKSIGRLGLRRSLGVNITRVSRNGIDLLATPELTLQLGDRVTVVGGDLSVAHAEKVLGNQMKRIAAPNLIPIFLGIMLGCVVANVPFVIPGIGTVLRLGLTGGPLVAAILIGRFGPKYNLVTYNTLSANLMLREVGLCIFLACVGLGTGAPFAHAVATGEGLRWLAYGAAITMVPMLLGGLIGRYALHINFYTLLGVLAGANTNPAALAYVRDQTTADAPAVGYATVFPLAMFLRIVTVQVLIFALG